MEDVVWSFEYDDLTEWTNINLEEEVEHAVCIAVVNYDGTDTPQMGSLAESKNNFVLGAELRRNATIGKYTLWITKKQDYETPLMQTYRFPIIIESLQRIIALNIQNIDDNPPVIQANERNCKIEENYAGPSNCTYVISDADGYVDEISQISKTKISLIATPDDGVKHFELITSGVGGVNAKYQLNAVLNVVKSLDFENITMFSLFIRAVDGVGNEGNLTTVVEVIDMPDEPPVWTRISAAENILEKSSKTFTVEAIDGDIQINDEINYRMEVNEAGDEKYFGVDQKTGVITINPIDRDALRKEIFRFLIFAYEVHAPGFSINATIIVIVEDINDHSPEITPEVLTIEIDEEKYTTLEFNPAIAITDTDLAENAQFSVSLVDQSKYNWSSAFLVVPTSGYQNGIFTISVVNASLLDYEDENWKVIDIQLRAIEKANSSHIGTKNIHIQLKDWNDELPIFDKDTPSEVSIPEDVGINHFIATVHATDRDAEDINLKHSLVAQRTLAIDEKSGNITTSENGALDYESMRVVVVQVVATDLANHKTYAVLTINVIDVNDVPPQLVLPKKTPSLLEEVDTGTEVDTLITATDPDTDAELVFSIDWEHTKAHKSSVPVDQSLYSGHLNIRTDWPEKHKRYAEGTLVVTGRIDYEAFDVMFLTILVTDLKTVHNENTTSASLTLNIIDINDNSPIFDPIEPMKVIENQVSGAVIAPVTAKDADGPEFNKVSYYITPINGTKANLIAINETTGVIKVDMDKGIDAEEYEYIYYNVTATDGERVTNETIGIFVIDENDEVPYLPDKKYNWIIHKREKSPNGTEIVTLSAKDRDRTSPYNNVSYLINANYPAPLEYFSIGRFDGLLQVHLTGDNILDRDFGTPQFTLNLILRDNYLVDNVMFNTNTVDNITVTVILDDINDQKPELPEKTVPAIKVSENVKKDEFIFTVIAEDRDDPTTNNTKVFYEIRNISSADGTDVEPSKDCAKLFEVKTREQKEADIFANCDLRGYYGSWNVELYAQDLGTDPGPQNDKRIYVVQISDFNYYDPVIVFPTSKTIPLKEEQKLYAPLLTYDDQELNNFNATDKDHGDSGTVTFTLSSTTGDHEYFEMVSISKNVEQLRLAKHVNVDEQKTYKMLLTATDGGNPSRRDEQELTLSFISILGPEFVESNEWTVWIKENKTGLDFWQLIPKAHDMISEAGENTVDIYYFFMEEDNADTKFFALDKATRNLTVIEELDREKQETMTLTVVATTDRDGPPKKPLDAALLKITVVVVDENDNPPIFESKLYTGGIASEDALDKLILTVKATDKDLNDTLTYSEVADSMTSSDPSLGGISKPFYVDPETGDLTLKFTATSNMKGYFSFSIVVHDAVKHSDNAVVQINIVEQKNRVVFTFNNTASDVKDQRQFIIDSFKDAFGYICNIDDIAAARGTNGQVLDNVTSLTTHFISREDHLPISSDEIIVSSSDLQIITNLKVALLTRSLRLVDVPTGSSSPTADMEQTVHWILVSLTIFFCLCSIVMLVVFVLRTRRLTERLDKLAFTKYGSEESGLDRAGVVPTTNRFALAGSNPIWNTKENTINDNVSQGSGDSDLIGVEDNPDFGFTKGALASNDTWENVKRGSVNPIFVNSGAISGDPFERTYPEEEKKNIYN